MLLVENTDPVGLTRITLSEHLLPALQSRMVKNSQCSGTIYFINISISYNNNNINYNNSVSSGHFHSTISYQYLLRLITSIDTTLGDNSQSGMGNLLLITQFVTMFK